MSLTMPYPSARPLESRGFTMIELLVALSIGVILTVIAIPSYRGFIATQRIKTASYDLSYSLVLARSEAIKRGSNVVLEPASACWADGWAIKVGTTTLSTQAAYRDLKISAATNPAQSLTYNAEGRLTATATPFQIESKTTTQPGRRCVNVDLSGLPSTKNAACVSATVACP